MAASDSGNANDASKWTIERVVTEIYGLEDGKAPPWNRDVISGKTWFSFEKTEFEDSYTKNADPTKWWEPRSREHPDYNKLTLGRMTEYNFYQDAGERIDYQNNWITINYYEGSDTGNSVWGKFYEAVTNLKREMTVYGNSVLDAASFRHFGELLETVRAGIEAQQTKIQQMVKDMYGEYSGVRGNGADAFVARLEGLHDDMHDLQTDMKSKTPVPAPGEYVSSENSNLPELFKNDVPQHITSLSNNFISWWDNNYSTLDPGWLVNAVVHNIWVQNIEYLHAQQNQQAPAPNPLQFRLIDHDGVELAGSPVNLENAGDLANVDRLVKEHWKKGLQAMDAAIGPAAAGLSQLFGDINNRLRHTITDFVDPTAPPTTTGNGNGNGNGNLDLDDILNHGGNGNGGGGGGGGGGGNHNPFEGLPDLTGGGNGGGGGGGGGGNNPFTGLPNLNNLLTNGGNNNGGGGKNNPFEGLPNSTGGGGNSFSGLTGNHDPFAGLPGSNNPSGGVKDPFGPISHDPFEGLPSTSNSGGSHNPFTGLPSISGGLPNGHTSPSLSSLGGGKASHDAGAFHNPFEGLPGSGGGAGSSLFPTSLDGSSLGGGGGSDFAGMPLDGLGHGLVPTSDFATGGGPLGGIGDAGGAFGAAGGAAGAAGGAAAGGAGGSPMMPPMGGGMGGMGGGGNNKENERERTTWLAEEEEIWGTDPDVAPAVVGRESAQPQQQRPGGPQQQPRTGGPYAPNRTGTQRPGRA